MPGYVERFKNGGTFFLRGALGPHCSSCAALGINLCDFPVGEGKTCDLPICGAHSTEVAPNLHYCLPHQQMWEKFCNAGGVEKVLENVIPFKDKT